MEVLYDLDIEAKEAAQKSGLRLLRAQTVGEHPLFAKMMAELKPYIALWKQARMAETAAAV